MAVEIRELVIKAVIVDEQSREIPDSRETEAGSKDQIIQECVNQVLKIIRKSQNR